MAAQAMPPMTPSDSIDRQDAGSASPERTPESRAEDGARGELALGADVPHVGHVADGEPRADEHASGVALTISCSIDHELVSGSTK